MAAVVFAVLGLLSVGCARQQGGTVMLQVSPGEGTITVTEPTSGGRNVCAEDCVLTYPRGTRVSVRLRSRRPGNPTTTRPVYLGTDLSLRGDWQDRSGYRIGGGLLLFGGLVAASAIIGVGVAAMSSASSAWLDTRALGGITIGIGGAVGLATLIFGSILLGTDDRPVLLLERLPPRVAPYLTPTEDGAMLGVVGEY